MKDLKLYNLFEWALRFNVFFKLCHYGLGKIIGGQFYLKGAIPEEIGSIPLEDTGSYNLAWTFFGHSKGYILAMGISQIIGAVLFLMSRTKLLGGLMIIPILVNIILVDIFYKVAYGALFSACFYLLSVLIVLYGNRGKLVEAVQLLFTSVKNNEKSPAKWKKVLLGALAFAIIFGVELVFIGLFGYEDR